MTQIKIVKPLKALAKKKPGRKLTLNKLSEEDLQNAREALEIGVPISRIPPLLGISRTAFDRLLKKSGGLSVELLRCKENGVKKHLQNIVEKSAKNWLCSAWWLDRTQDGQFSQQTRTSSGSQITLNLQAVMAAQAKRPSETGNKTVDV